MSTISDSKIRENIPTSLNSGGSRTRFMGLVE
jgi:hypothetical protein